MRATTSAERYFMIALAASAMVWAIVRAHVQAITIDEAVTFTNFIRPAVPRFLDAHANNHVLNSMLAWGFTRIFGVSNLVVRSGALIGAAIYIAASYFLCALIAERFLLRASLFICLVFNPLIFDFLVAARGYGLASGFLLSAICLVAYALAPDAKSPRVDRACVAASLCIALSFLSNFSFAFVDAACIVMLYVWASRGKSLQTRLALAATCFLPGLILAGGLSYPVLRHWEQSQLNYGADSLRESFQSLYEASFYQLNPPRLRRMLSNIPSPGILLSILGFVTVWRAWLVLIYRRSLRDPFLAAVPIAATATALVMHWLLFRILSVPLPKDRTGIYIVVLSTLLAGILAAFPIPTRAGEISRRGMTIAMVAVGFYFLLCVRMNYFKEWKWDSDTDKLYSVVASYNHACGLKDIGPNWRYDAALNYYRNASGRETFPEFPHSDDLPVGKRAYVLYEPEDRAFLASHRLNVVYRRNDAAIAFNLEVEPTPGESQCPAKPPGQDK